MPYRILLRRDTLINWNENNPVLMTGEPGYETDTGKFKVGDGQKPWSALDYYAGVTGGTGPIGPIGVTGATGANGSSGTSGTSGSSGSSGTSGVDGNFYGSSGSSGTSGIDGSSGTSGIDGPTGAFGSSGTSGSDGTSGINGPTGSPGSSGTSGVSPGYSPIPYAYQNTGNISLNSDGQQPLNTGRMFGVGETYTPTSLGTINLGFIFGVNISSDFMPTDDYLFSIRYGTGTPPVTSDPLTGTLLASQSYGTVANNQDGVTNMYLNAIASGLTLGVQYWFDVSITSTEAYPPTAKFTGTDITYSLFELSGGMGSTGASITISGAPGVTASSVGWGKVNIGGSDYWVPLYQ